LALCFAVRHARDEPKTRNPQCQLLPRKKHTGRQSDRYTHRRAIAHRELRVFSPANVCGGGRNSALLASLRFIWNATTGHRLRPWRSEYIRWRIETYSGMKAEELTARDVLGFVWREKGNLLRFLRWTDRMETWKKAGAIRQGTGD